MSRTFAALLALFAACTAIANFSPADEPPKSAETAQAKGNFEPLGSVGCSASACHGKPDAKYLTEKPGDDCWKASATIFHAADAHTKAYEVLLNPLSQQISAKLKTGIPAHEDPRCLACHTNPTLANSNVSESRKKLRVEGVSCEACHGNSEKWVADHTNWTRGPKSPEQVATGYNDMASSGIAATCVKCHIGAPGDANSPPRDMNHDMIAAGHPRLDLFDFAALLSRARPHWKARPEPPKEPVERLSFAVAEWLKGNAAATDALKTLSASRRQRFQEKDARTPFPELSEQSCVNCHHALKPDRPLPVIATNLKIGEKPALPSTPAELQKLPWHEIVLLYRYLAVCEAQRRQNGGAADPEIEKNFATLQSQILDSRNYDPKPVAEAIAKLLERIPTEQGPTGKPK